MSKSLLNDLFPLSKIQQGLLLHSELSETNQFYISQVRITVEHPVDLVLLRQSCQLAVNHHPILRASISSKDLQQALLLIHNDINVNIKSHDISHYNNKEKTEKLNSILKNDFSKKIDIIKAPLMRFALVKLSRRKYIFLWTHHHVLLSGNEVAQVLKEIFEYYDNGGVRKKNFDNSDNYQKYINLLKQYDYRSSRSYWQQLLKGYESKELLLAKNLETRTRYKHVTLTDSISQKQLQSLQQHAKKNHVSDYTILAAGWAIVLSLFSNNSDIVFGSVRSFPEKSLQGVLGLFINTLPVRVKFNKETQLAQLYKNIRKQQIKLRKLVHTPLGDINKLMKLEPGKSLFDTYIDFKPLSVNEVLTNLNNSWAKRSFDYSLDTHYKLYVEIYGEQQKLMFRIHYDENTYDAENIKLLMQYFKTVISQLTSEDITYVIEADGLSDQQRKQRKHYCQGKVKKYYSKESAIHKFESHVARRANNIAVIDDKLTITYAMLNRLANQLAYKIISKTHAQSKFIGICLSKSYRYVIAILAIQKTNNAYVPLDPTYPVHRLKHIINDCAMPLIIVEDEKLNVKNKIIYCSDKDLILQPTTNLKCRSKLSDLAYAIYTSGTTGQPKGVPISNKSLVNLVEWHQHTYSISSKKNIALVSPFTFDAATWMLWSALANGATLCLIASNIIKDPVRLQRELINSHIDQTFIPAAMVNVLLSLTWPRNVRLKQLLTGGEKINVNTTPPKSMSVINHYGPTEYTVITTANVNYQRLSEINYLGRPIDNTTIYICDQLGRPTPYGIPGELCISGVGLTKGYIGSPKLTKQVFVAVTNSNLMMYKTGDLVRLLPAGQIEFIGRSDDQVKIRGYRIELGEIDSVFYKYAGIRSCCANVITGPTGQKQIVLYYIESKHKTNKTQLESFAKKYLPDFMLPQTYVDVKRFELTAHGKIDRSKLPVIISNLPAHTTVNQKKQHGILTVVCQIIANILSIKVNKINPNASLFDYGGDSISVMQLVLQLHNLGYAINADDVFKQPTIVNIANNVHIDKQNLSKFKVEPYHQRSFLATPIQQWYLRQANVSSDRFNQSIIIAIKNKIDCKKLELVFKQLIKKHDALRLSFKKQKHNWFALSSHSENEFKLQHNFESIEKVNFDLSKDLLLYAAIDNYPNPTKLFISIHHLAVDVVSWQILLQDLEYFYLHGASRKALKKQNPGSSFQQWAQALEDHKPTLLKSTSAHYWRNILETYKVIYKNSTPKINSYVKDNRWLHVRHLAIKLPLEVTYLLFSKANSAYNTKVIDLIVTALLDSFSKQQDSAKLLALLIESHGRTNISDLQPNQIVGWFTTLAPLIVQTPAEKYSDKIKYVKDLLNEFSDKAFNYSLLSTCASNEFANPIPVTELIGFNYLGIVNTASNSKMLVMEKATVSLDVDPNKKRPLLIELLAYVNNSELHLEVTYNEKFTTANEMQKKLGRFSRALTSLVNHCCGQTVKQYSLCDFKLLHTSQKVLDQFIIENINPILQSPFNIKLIPKITDIYPLSPLQEGIHFLSLKTTDSDFYHVQTILEIKDSLDNDLFKEAAFKVISHFDIFRTGFVTSHDLNSVQFVLSDLTVPWQYYDWSHETDERKQRKFKELITIDQERIFNLSDPPLIRCYLVKQSNNHYRFILAYHHILMGGWSMSLVVGHIFNYYQALKSNQYYALPMAREYRPYVEWVLGSDLIKAKKYWTKLLGSFHTSTKLTNENYLADLKDNYYKRQKHTKALDRKTLEELRKLASSSKLTLNTLLLGAWCYTISRYADSKDIVIGITLATRPEQIKNVGNMVGFLNSTLPIRATYHSDDKFIDYIRHIQHQLFETQKYQYSKLVDIHRCTGLKNNESLFDYLYVFENYPLDNKALKKFKVDSLRVIEKPHYKITLTITAAEDLTVNVNYDQSVFSNADIEQLMSSYIEVLSSLPDCHKDDMRHIEIINQKGRNELLKLWRADNLRFDRSMPLREYYQKQFERVPSKIAVAFNDVSISYRTLDIQSTKFANQFLSYNVKPGSMVAVILDRDLSLVYTLVAIVKLGCTVLPIDPNYPPQRINDILFNAKPNLIVTKKIFSKKIKGNKSKSLYIDLCQSELAMQSAKLPDFKISNHTPAYILFTSGSTGKPKGVVISYASLINFLHSAKKLTGVNQHNKFLIATTYTFDIFNYEFHTPFMLGATGTLIEHKDQISGKNLVNIIAKNKINVIQATPVTWGMLFSADFIPKKNQKLISGGDVMTKQLARDMKTNGASVYNIYGPSETTIWSSCYEIKEINDKIASIPIGIPLNNTYFYVLNADMQFVPKNTVGTLFIGGEGIGLGYLNDAKLTRNKFIRDPYNPKKIIYNSGDLVKLLRSGYFVFVGRSDNQVKIHGYRIELSEIESQLNHINQIKQSAVIIKSNDDNVKQLIAFLTVSLNQSKLTSEELKNILAEKLPKFMIPSHFEYIVKMPLSSSHKIDKKILEKMKLHLPSSVLYANGDNKYNKLIQIWSEILLRDPNSVRIDDDFFAIGGNSIQAVSLITKINHALNTEFGVNDLFVYPTIRELYSQVQTATRKIEYSNQIDTKSIKSPIVCLQKEGKGSPLFLLHPIGGTLYIYQPLIQALGETRPIYGIYDPSITTNDLLFTSFREMASYYVSLIKQTQAKGPYHLLGASFGANMVEEISKQLIQHGDIVAFTGLLDGWAHYPAKALKNKEWFYANLTRQHKMVAKMIGKENQGLSKSLLAINWHRQQLLAKHKLSYSENKISLFKAKELTPVLREIDSEFNYWDMYYPGGLNLHIVPGDHETMLLPPNVKYLAQQILLYLIDKDG
jgi:iturin family lipopeptide synthetase B